MQWPAMCIFLFLKFYNFMKGIVCIYIWLSKKLKTKTSKFVAGFLQSGALHTNIRHDPTSDYNQWKSECSKCQQSWGVWGYSETPAGVSGGRAPWKNLGSKEHLDWLKIDFNVVKIITVPDYNKKKSMWMEVHI